jgi:hypothetical protein
MRAPVPSPAVAQAVSLFAYVVLSCGERDDVGGDGSTDDAGSSEGELCDPASEAIGPMPHDEVGDPCCTEKPGCTGYDAMGQPANALYLGETLACVDGTWQLDPEYCADTCEDGREYIGCFWDSDRGDFVRPICGCR